MTAGNLAKWIDELQAQIDTLRMKVAKSGDTITPTLTTGEPIATINDDTTLYTPVAKAPFISLSSVNIPAAIAISDSTYIEALYDSMIVLTGVTDAIISKSGSSLDGSCPLPVNADGGCVAFVKQGQFLYVNPDAQSQSSNYRMWKLIGATQPTQTREEPGGLLGRIAKTVKNAIKGGD